MRKLWIAAALVLALIGPSPHAGATTTVDPISGAFPFAILSGQTVSIGFKLTTDDNVGDITLQIIFTTLTIDISSCVNLGAPGFNCIIDEPGGTVTVTAGNDLFTGPQLGNGQDLVSVSFTATGPVGTVNLGIFPGTFFTACDLAVSPCVNPTPTAINNQGALVALITPEPTTGALLGLGLLGLAGLGRRRPL